MLLIQKALLIYCSRRLHSDVTMTDIRRCVLLSMQDAGLSLIKNSTKSSIYTHVYERHRHPSSFISGMENDPLDAVVRW